MRYQQTVAELQRGVAAGERRRPSYLIEMDDVFHDGRKVAPPVIGEDPPDYYD